MTTRAQAVELVREALAKGLILHARSPGGDEYTAGPYTPAIGSRPDVFLLNGYGQSRWVIQRRVGSDWEIADILVDRVGRGEGRRAVATAEKASERRLAVRENPVSKSWMMAAGGVLAGGLIAYLLLKPATATTTVTAQLPAK